MTETEAETVNKEDSEARGLQRQDVRAPSCRKGTLKIVLKNTGECCLCFFIKEYSWSPTTKILDKTNFTLSECLVLPVMVLLAVVAYASLAAIFYNTDG